MPDPDVVDPELLKRLLDPTDLRRIMDPARHSDLALAESIDKTRPRVATVVPETGAAPAVDTSALAAPSLGKTGEAKTLPTLSYKEQQRLPVISAGAPAGSAASYETQLERLQAQKEHPWGTEENHPGRLGRIGHVLGQIGNIAGDVVAPGVMANIPGTALNREAQIHAIEPRLEAARRGESEAGLKKVQAENLESEIKQRELANKENLVNDAQGNVVGWKDKNGGLRSLDDPETPQGIKDIAETSANKLAKPTFEKDEAGNIVKLSTDKTGKTSSEVVYKGDPKVKTETRDVMVDGKLHAAVFDITPNSKNFGKKLADLGETKVPGGETAKEHEIEVVRAYDKNNKPHLLSKSDAEAEGYTHVTKASDKDVDDARTHTAVLNDMQAKLNDVVASRKALDQDLAQRAIIARSLRSLDKYKTIGQLADAGILAGATPQTQEYIQSVLSLRESALGLPKELTKGSRVTEIQSSALWATLPGGASLNGDYALSQSKKFQANIDRMRDRVDEVRGIAPIDMHPDLVGKKEAGAGEVKPPHEADPGMKWQHRYVNGQIEWRQTKTP